MTQENDISITGTAFIAGIFKVIGMIAGAVVLALVSLYGFSCISIWISRYEDYIFYLIPGSSMFVFLGIIYFWVFVFFYKIQMKTRALKIIAIMLSIVGLFYSFTTYQVIQENKIILHNPLNLNGKIYSYDDVCEIYTGISDDKDSNLYYKIKLKDGKTVNLTTASMDTKEENYEVAIYHIDQKLVKNGVKKNIDRKNIDKFYDEDYNENYVKNVEKILQ